jgi:hypothetical protein
VLVGVCAAVGCTVQGPPDAPVGAAGPSSGPSESSGGAASGGSSGSSGSSGSAADAGTPSVSTCTVPAPSKAAITAAGNGSFASAQTLELAQTASATLAPNDATHYYAVTLPACSQDGVLELTITQSSALRSVVTVYTDTQTKIVSQAAPDATTSPFTMKFYATAGKKYFVAVEDVYTISATMPYQLEVTYLPVPDAFERNDTFADAKPAPVGPFDFYLFAGDQTNGGEDVDYFTISAPTSATKLHVHIQNKSTSAAPQRFTVNAFDATKSAVGHATGSDEQADVDAVIDLPTQGGTFYVAISSVYDHAGSPVASTATLTVE